MSLQQIFFLVVSAVIVASAVMVVSARRMMHAALWLITSLFGVAIIFALLQAGFFAVIQVVVYIGAIAILIIFAVMLTRRSLEDPGGQLIRYWWLAALAGLGVFVALVGVLSQWSGFGASLPALSTQAPPGEVSQLGLALVSPDAYVLPFEVASVLLLVALVGAIAIAWDRKPPKG